MPRSNPDGGARKSSEREFHDAVFASGARGHLDTVYDAFTIAHEAIERGAIGVDMGRNIWQSEHPVAALRAVRAIVHEHATSKQAA